jgi:RimJ/RimL family protein N-acetyltransferase
MTAAFKTALNEFLIPYMGIRHMQSGYLEGNFASRRVLEKCGFVFSKLIPEAIEVQESKCGVKGKKVALGHMQWDLS